MFFLFVLFIPLYGALVGLLRGGLGGRFIDTSYITAGVYFIGSLIYFDEKTDTAVFLKAAFTILRLLCATILLCFITVLAKGSQDWIYYFINRGLLFFGTRHYGHFSLPYIYFITSPMLIFLLSYDAWRFFDKPSLKRLLLLFFTVATLFLSGTRAHMIISIVGVLLICLWHRYKRRSILYFTAIVLLLIFVFFTLGSGVFADVFSSHDQSNAKKLEYLKSYYFILSDPATFIFGQGFNAHVWSKVLSVMVNYGEASKTELTYLEYVRVFGLVGVIVVLAVVFIIQKSFLWLPHRFQWIEPALLLYLAVSALNPYIFSSNGMLVIGLSAVVLARESGRKGKEADGDASRSKDMCEG